MVVAADAQVTGSGAREVSMLFSMCCMFYHRSSGSRSGICPVGPHQEWAFESGASMWVGLQLNLARARHETAQDVADSIDSPRGRVGLLVLRVYVSCLTGSGMQLSAGAGVTVPAWYILSRVRGR